MQVEHEIGRQSEAEQRLLQMLGLRERRPRLQLLDERPPDQRGIASRFIAEIIDPLTGEATPVATQSSGVFYARSSLRFATPGKRLGKVAGTSAKRSGRLLSP